MDHFLFLYPIDKIFDFEIQNHGWHEKGGVEAYKSKYATTLNRCIDERYRQKGYVITFALFNDEIISEIIKLEESDRLIYVGLNFATHTTKLPNGEFPYPDNDVILGKLEDVSHLRVAGFHMWDCVERLAKRAYERKINVLVDEELTEFFGWRLKDDDFRTDKYPTYDPRKLGEVNFKWFMEARKNRPWLWQRY